MSPHPATPLPVLLQVGRGHVPTHAMLYPIVEGVGVPQPLQPGASVTAPAPASASAGPAKPIAAPVVKQEPGAQASPAQPAVAVGGQLLCGEGRLWRHAPA